MRTQSKRVALCGMFCALAVIMMFLGNLLPFSTFFAPALAGLCLIPVMMEFGVASGWLTYAAVSILSLLFVADKETALFFVGLLGFYPLLKVWIERIRSKVISYIVKLAVCNIAVAAIYCVLIFLFRLDYVVAELTQTGPILLAALWVLGNLTFVIYDRALNSVVAVYNVHIHSKLNR